MRLIDADAFKKWLLENSINEREEKESRQIGIWIDAFLSTEPDVPDTNVGDMISRQEILRAFEEMCSCTDYGWDERDFRDLIKKIPSAEPERKKGKWIRNFDGNEWYWFCSNCKEEWYEEDLWMGGNDFPNFCPNCGCQMNGGEQE